MLTIRACKDEGHALGEYLRQADYYSQRLQVEGICFGQLCGDLGLEAGQTICDKHFENVARNRHAETGEQLTDRMSAARRAGYDATFSAPKSVSVQALIGGDARLIGAHDKAVRIALAEMETAACCQIGQGVNKRFQQTGTIAGAMFRHCESRALDPQLHTHPFVFNVTRGPDGRLMALETAEIFARVPFLTEVYRNALAAEVQSLGYRIRKAENGFELDGVPAELLERFSKRSKERDAAIALRESELGRELSKDEIAILVRENRPRKLVELSPEEVRQSQLSQVTAAELQKLERLRESASRPVVGASVSLSDAVERAKEHVFERQAVVDDHRLMAEVLRADYGHHSLAEVRGAIEHGRHGLLVVDGRVSTAEAVGLERDLVEKINQGIGSAPQLGRMPAVGMLSDEQRSAVQQMLDSRDAVQVFRGKAGTGKTTTLSAVIEGCSAVGLETVCFAPSTKAVEVLRRDGEEQAARGSVAATRALTSSATLQRLFADPTMQEGIVGKVVVVDEYGLLSTRDLKRLVDLGTQRGCRVLLVGDAAQHTSVEASAAARVIERESRVAVAEIREVRRQASNREYLAAAKAIANGHIGIGLQRLDKMGAVVEIPDPEERRRKMVDEWFAVAHVAPAKGQRPATALMVAPTWAEIDELNSVARARLRAAGILRGADRTISSLEKKDWTRAQLKNVNDYVPGDVVVARKRTKQFDKGDELLVVRREADRLVLRSSTGREISCSPKQSGTAWTVSERRELAVAVGDQLRLRAVASILGADGKRHRLANGSTVTVGGVDAAGRVRLADGATLLSREFVHGYACTSHASQGTTVDAVFMTDPISLEGLYVSATRGREKIRVFTGDKASLLDAARLRSEDRMSATEFSRLLPEVADRHRGIGASGIRGLFDAGVRRGRELALGCLRLLRPSVLTARSGVFRGGQSLGVESPAGTEVGDG
jgi:conjugative relaxase-like TrwC/TraI family protein